MGRSCEQTIIHKVKSGLWFVEHWGHWARALFASIDTQEHRTRYRSLDRCVDLSPQKKKHSGIVLHAVHSCRNTVGRALSHSTSAHTHTLTYGSLSIVINTSHGKLFLRPVHFPLPCLALRIRRSYLSRKFCWNQSWILIAA